MKNLYRPYVLSFPGLDNGWLDKIEVLHGSYALELIVSFLHLFTRESLSSGLVMLELAQEEFSDVVVLDLSGFGLHDCESGEGSVTNKASG